MKYRSFRILLTMVTFFLVITIESMEDNSEEAFDTNQFLTFQAKPQAITRKRQHDGKKQIFIPISYSFNGKRDDNKNVVTFNCPTHNNTCSVEYPPKTMSWTILNHLIENNNYEKLKSFLPEEYHNALTTWHPTQQYPCFICGKKEKYNVVLNHFILNDLTPPSPNNDACTFTISTSDIQKVKTVSNKGSLRTAWEIITSNKQKPSMLTLSALKSSIFYQYNTQTKVAKFFGINQLAATVSHIKAPCPICKQTIEGPLKTFGAHLHNQHLTINIVDPTTGLITGTISAPAPVPPKSTGAQKDTP